MKTITSDEYFKLSTEERRSYTGIIKWNKDTISHIKDGEYHRLDGPAYYSVEGYKEWRIEGKLHREDGPAVVYPDGREYYFLEHKNYSKLEWIKRTQQFQDVLKYKNL